MVGKSSILVESKYLDCNGVPTYSTVSSEDHLGCCIGYIKPKGFI